MSDQPAPDGTGGAARSNGCRRIGRWPQSPDQFRELVELLGNSLVRHAFRKLGSLQDSEDIVQEVLVKSYARRAEFRDTVNVTAYLYRMVGNACIDFLRKKGGRELFMEDMKHFDIPARGSDCPEEEALRELRRIETLLSGLPGEQAEVIRLRVMDELSFVEIAGVLETPLPTIKSRFRYGIEKLRKKISRERTVGE